MFVFKRVYIEDNGKKYINAINFLCIKYYIYIFILHIPSRGIIFVQWKGPVQEYGRNYSHTVLIIFQSCSNHLWQCFHNVRLLFAICLGHCLDVVIHGLVLLYKKTVMPNSLMVFGYLLLSYCYTTVIPLLYYCYDNIPIPIPIICGNVFIMLGCCLSNVWDIVWMLLFMASFYYIRKQLCQTVGWCLGTYCYPTVIPLSYHCYTTVMITFQSLFQSFVAMFS